MVSRDIDELRRHIGHIEKLINVVARMLPDDLVKHAVENDIDTGDFDLLTNDPVADLQAVIDDAVAVLDRVEFGGQTVCRG